MSNELICIEDIQKMATAACKSGLFAMPSPEAALTLMLLCQAEGLHPIQALRQFHIIKNKPAMRSDAMLASFQKAGGSIQWLEVSDTACSAKFSHPQGGELVVEWTMEMAKKAQLTGNPTWQKFPRAMMQARCISSGVRAVFPAVICGLYCPEEVQDMVDVTPEKPKPTKPALKRVENVPVGTIHADDKQNATAATVSPTNDAEHLAAIQKGRALVDKIAAERGKPAGLEPEDAEIVKPELVAADRPSAGEMAAQLKQIRKLAQEYGCKTAGDFGELMVIIVGRNVDAATSLSDDERSKAIAWLADANTEKGE